MVAKGPPRGYSIHLAKDIMFKSEDEKTDRKIISALVPEKLWNILKEVKGEDAWVSLLIDGAKHRGVEIEYFPNFHYKTHYYCSSCQKWIPHEKGVHNVARARARCPKCFGSLRTRRR